MKHTAKRLPHLLGPAAWNAILPNQPAPFHLESDKSADIVIIGAGFAGLSAAERITQLDPGASIIILDAMRLAESSAGRNSGFMVDLPHVLTSENYAGESSNQLSLTLLNRQAIEFAGHCVDNYGIQADFFDKAGKINGASSSKADAHNQAYAKTLDHMGETYERLDEIQMREITGSEYYLSGLFTPGTAVLQPAGYIRGLAEGLMVQRGVHIYENSPVTGFEKQGNAWIVQTGKAKISAQKMILANNGHLESFGFAQNQLMHIFLYASMTPNLDLNDLTKLGGQPRWGITPSDPMGTTMRRIDMPLGGHRIITRCCATLKSSFNIKKTELAHAAHIHQQKFEQRFPQLKGIKMEYQWVGHLCLTRNDVSYVREVDEGVFSACVQNGLGTARGTLTGIAAAEMALGVRSDVRDYFERQSEPPTLPPEPFRGVGANLYIRFKEWLARGE